jgi:hypothetical protein
MSASQIVEKPRWEDIHESVQQKFIIIREHEVLMSAGQVDIVKGDYQ